MSTTTKKAPAKKPPAKRAAKKAAAKSAVDNAGIREHRDLPLRMLVKHPHNPRHRAVADPELVASVKSVGILQDLVVAPMEGDVDKVVVITGHRRLDAAKKAKLASVPVIIRRDLATEASQIEAMIVENIHRADLTPIEEAEGYAQLELIGYKAPAIAAKVGVDVKTVRGRLKLLKLSTSTRKKVHAGQLTLTDAAAITEFAEDVDATKRLEQAAARNDSYSFKQQISAERRRRDQERDVAVRKAKLLDRGAAEVEVPEGQTIFALIGSDLQRLEDTHSADWGQHKKCLAFAAYISPYGGPQIYELCSDPTSHRDRLAAEERKRREEEDARVKAAEERTLAQAAAADTRVGTLMALVEGAALPPAVGDLIRTLLPIRIRELHVPGLEAYQLAMGISAEDRWTFLGSHGQSRAIDRTRYEQHLVELANGDNRYAAAALCAFLVAEGERVNGQHWEIHHHEQAIDYFGLLEEAGHAFSPIDGEQRTAHQDALDAVERKAS